MDIHQIEESFEKVNQALIIISLNEEVYSLTEDNHLTSLFADILAILRSQVALASDNRSVALFILKNINNKNLLTNLLHQFSVYCGYIKSLIGSSQTIAVLYLSILLRLLQFFHNLLNLHISFENDYQENTNFVDNFLPLFDFEYLRYACRYLMVLLLILLIYFLSY